MSAEQVFVEVTEEFTYRIDRSSVRTLPAGWRGAIPADAAKKLKADKKGKAASEPKAAKGDSSEE